MTQDRFQSMTLFDCPGISDPVSVSQLGGEGKYESRRKDLRRHRGVPGSSGTRWGNRRQDQ